MSVSIVKYYCRLCKVHPKTSSEIHDLRDNCQLYFLLRYSYSQTCARCFKDRGPSRPSPRALGCVPAPHPQDGCPLQRAAAGGQRECWCSPGCKAAQGQYSHPVTVVAMTRLWITSTSEILGLGCSSVVLVCYGGGSCVQIKNTGKRNTVYLRSKGDIWLWVYII